MTIVYKDNSPTVIKRTGDSSILQYILGFNFEYEARYLNVNSLIYNKVPLTPNTAEINRDIYALGGFMYSIITSQEYQESIRGSQGVQGELGSQGPQGYPGYDWGNHEGEDINHLRFIFSESTEFNNAISTLIKLLFGNIRENTNQWDLEDTTVEFHDYAEVYSKINKFRANNQ